MELETEYTLIAVVKDEKVISVMEARHTQFFMDGYEMAGGDLDEITFNQIGKITLQE